jgi:dienelactone hydrolase
MQVLRIYYSRLLILLLLTFWTQALRAQAPPAWLNEVAVPKDAVAPPASTIVPVPEFKDQQALKTYQQETLNRWVKYLGAFEHSTRKERTIRWKETTEHEPGLSRSWIEYETEPGQWTEALILRPTKIPSSKKLPAVVVFHSTVNNSMYQPVGLIGPNSKELAGEDEMRKAFALHLARRGYVTISPRNFLWPTSQGVAAKEEAAKFNGRNPDRKGMARMLLDSLIAVDVLASLENVDPQKIGAIGHSLGAKEVLYLSAFDSRIKATVSSEGGLGIQQSNWDAAWYLGSQCTQPDFSMNHHQLLAAIAPRSFLLIGGDDSDGQASLPYLQQALGAYQASGSPSHLGFYNHRQGHEVTDESLQRSLQWLDWHLKQ